MTDVLAVLPLGATEQHGRHLPVTTDALLAEAACAALYPGPRSDAVEVTDGSAVVLPVLAFGASGEHEGVADGRTVSVGTEALAAVLLEIGRSAGRWARKLLVVNAHGGNVDALRRAVPRLRAESREAAWLPLRTAEHAHDTHAGHAETSLLLHLYPDAVRMDAAAVGCTAPLPQILDELRTGGVAAVSPGGVLGDPTTATADEGSRLWRLALDDARDRLRRWDVGHDGMLR